MGRAMVVLHPKVLAYLLDLPEGTYLKAVHFDPYADALVIHIAGPGLPDTPPNLEPPKAAAHFESKTVEIKRLRIVPPDPNNPFPDIAADLPL